MMHAVLEPFRPSAALEYQVSWEPLSSTLFGGCMQGHFGFRTWRGLPSPKEKLRRQWRQTERQDDDDGKFHGVPFPAGDVPKESRPSYLIHHLRYFGMEVRSVVRDPYK